MARHKHLPFMIWHNFTHELHVNKQAHFSSERVYECVICIWTTEWEEFDVVVLLWHSRILSVRLLSAFALFLKANEQKNSDYK